MNCQHVYEYESVRGAEYDVNGRHPVASQLTLTPRNIQGVHEVSLQLQKFITKANEKTDKWKLLQTVTYMFKFSVTSFNTFLY